MAISDTIENIQNHLKDDYQSIANLGADLTNVDKNIENIAELLDNVYDVLPKTSFQEGTEVTIEGGLKGKIDFDTDNGKKIVGYGDTEQDGEPTPTNEVPIQCVTGNQSIVESGKNLLHNPRLRNGNVGITMTKNDDGTIVLNGTTSSTEYIDFDVELQKVITYTISFSNGETTPNFGAGFRLSFYDSNNTNLNDTGVSGKISYTINLASKAVKAGVWVQTGNTFSNAKLYPQVAEISDTAYEPYHTPITYPISLGNNKFYKIGDYADELLYDVENDKVYKKAYIGETTFTGEEGWTQTSARQDVFYLPHEFFEIYTSQLLFSNIAKFKKYINATSEIDETGSYIYINQNAGYIYFQFPNITTLTEFKNIIQNSFAIYIQEPTLTEITDTTLINQVKALYNAHSNNGTTIIESNGDLPMIIKVRALKG